ncbi:hypothetical protein [Parvibaculum sp.]|uniref:hypothetical protein n=1 Tax=Parvibaculum sp. TaxID=2024848 RepID=UPI00272F9B41|nr:hypothetical protein [Parvibaculum sp.]MDP1626640.1 hypothetical protein [Parvibaculum sp.]MDP2150561.1 hypothetical protein [Parvibaculum sp.]MDP3327847.1 hypothetical protein [Parvibaculum sp.]
MVDVKGDARNVSWLDTAIDSAGETQAEGARTEAAGIVDMAIIGAGGLASISIAGLGIWKLAELII